MSDWTRKTRSAGPPVRDQRKKDQTPAKKFAAPKPREYALVVVETTVQTFRHQKRYPSRAARDQAKKDALKKVEAFNKGLWARRNAKRTVEFEETEE
jgi:hypothetical protein